MIMPVITITITMTVGLPLPVAVLLVKHGDGGSGVLDSESTQRNFRDRVKFKLKLDPA